MKGKSILYILLSLIILSASIGIVCASEDINDSTTDFSSFQEDIVIPEETSEVSLDTSHLGVANDISVGKTNDVLFNENESKNTSLKNIDSSHKSLLGISNEEDVLQANNIIKVQGNYFSDVRTAIQNANDGDIIDLQGKEIIGAPNGNPSISTNKQLTFINGIFNAGNITSIPIGKRNFIENCKFENITFKNFNDTCMYPNFFINCTLRHVSFENFTLAVAGFVIRNCILYDVNFTNCHSLSPEDENDYEYAAMAVTYNSVLDHCNFVNCTTNRHSGAICIAGQNGNRVDVFNSNFINCSAGVGGAIYVHGNAAINENYHSNIINCTFIGNTATQKGGAIGSSQNYLVVKNCTFENNTAKQGAAYMLAGISHGLDGIPEGHYNNIVDCYFRNNTGTEEGGAVHITGNYNNFINCTFWDNYATNGNGSAIYIHGKNSSVINSEFYEHECSRGTVYIIGDNTFIDNCTFENNTASRGGAGVYVVGNNTLVDNSVFNNNDAIFHGGALHSQGDNLRILNSNFTSNTAIASTDDMNQGLGGAIYIDGENSDISYCYFKNNVARNGSAVYNRGQNLTIEDDTFIENQAWSYLLTTISDKKRIYYDPEGVVTINVTHRGGDNIINAIHNDGSPSNIFFFNVTYESSVNDMHNTGNKLINPVDGVENSKNGTVLYQDSREDLQNITIILTHLETGKVLINFTSKTGILGNVSVSEKGLLPGNYSVNVTHFEDGLYKFITNMTYFEILPVADLAIEKSVSNKTPDWGDEIVWTLKVTNYGYNDATNAYVIDKLPDGLIFVDSDGNYNATTGRWEIGDLAYNETVFLKIRTVVNITNTTILNVATVNSSTHDPDEKNNIANNTTKSNTLTDLSVVKLVSKETSVIGDEVVWTIIVTNKGPDIAVNAYAIDKLPSTVDYISDDSNGKYNATTGRWEIGDLAKGDIATLKIKTKINTDNITIENNVLVNSSTPESNTTNNNASNKTTVFDSNFEVQKITITPLVILGDQVIFQIIVRNTGLTDLTGVFIEESSYDGLIFSHYLNQTHWTHSIVNGKNRWTLINKLGIDELASLTVVFNTTKEGTFTNVVVSGNNETDNKTAKNDTTVVTPKFTVEKVSLTPFVNVGDQVTFEIVVTNTGLVNITGMFVEEFKHDGLVFDHAYGLGNWIKDNNADIWRYSNVLTPGMVTNFFVVFNTTKKGNFTNIIVAGANKTDNKTANNTTEVVEPKFVVEKITLNSLVAVGEQVTFEIVISNTGRIDLNGVFVVESEYDGLVFDHAYGLGSQWVETVENNKHKWTYTDVLNPGKAHGFFVVFNTTKEGNFTNVVVAGANKTDNKTANNTTEVVEPKFVVEKITLNSLVAVGEQVTFEIAVTNTGRIDLNGVFVVESEYDGLVFDHAYGLGNHWVETVENNKHKWTYTDVLNPGKAHGFFVVFNTTKEGNFTNVVVAGADNTENKSANNTTEVAKPEFSVEKIALDPVVHVNNLTKFQIVIQNTGKIPITGLFLEETDYQNLTYYSFIDSDDWFFVMNGKYSWTYPKVLKPRDVVTLIVIFNATEVGNWTNTVTAGANNVENKTANNTTEVVKQPPKDPEWNATNPDISIEKIALDKLVVIGNTVTFDIVVHNIGDKRLHNVTVYEKFDDGLEFIRIIDNSGLWIDNKDLSFTLNDTLYKGETLKFYIEFNTTKLGVLRNIVNVSSNETGNKTANDTVEVVEPKLEINKVAVNSTVFVGSQVVFEILVRNTGKVDLNNVLVNETSYDGLTYVEWYDDTGLWTKNNDLTWSLKPSLMPSEYLGFFVVFNTTKTGNFTNVIVVKSDEVPNETANDTVEVLKPELSISKVAINKIIELGDQVTFEILVRNTGQVPLNNVTVNETSFDGLTYVEWYDDTGLWIKNNDLSWSLKPSLTVGEYLGFFVVFNTTKVGNFTNVVVAKSDEVPNETANDTVDVFKPEYTIEKVTINQTVLVGEQVIFEIIVHNTGKVNINNITVSELDYEGLTYVDWYDNTGLWTKNNDLSWTSKYDIYPNEIIGFFLVFNTTKEGTFENVVVAKSDKLPNKTANDTVDVLKPQIIIEKVTLNNTVVIGEQVIFEVIVWNSGSVDLNNVIVRELEFNGLTYDSWFDYTSKWIKNNDLSWTYNSTLPSNKHGYFYVVFNTTKVGNFTNVIVASSDKTNDTYANNTTSVIGADLAVEKFVSDSAPNYGDVIEWTIVVTNNGPADSKGVYVIDKLPVGLVYQSDDSQGAYDVKYGVWSIGDLAKGATVKLVIKTLVNISNATILNVAVVNGSTYDPNETNNVGNNSTDVNPAADLAVEKFVSNSAPNYGDVIDWTIVVVNNGPDVAKGVYVIDKLPVGLVYQSDDSEGNYNPVSGRWDVGDLAKGANAILVIKTLVNISNATILNVAVVNSSTYDPNETNNEANNTTNVNPLGDLYVEKICLTPIVNVGGQVTFEIVVRNTGVIDLNNVFVIESEYDGLVFDHAYGLDNYWVESNENGKHKWTYNDVFAVNNVHGFFVVFNTTRAGNFTNVVVARGNNTDNKTTNNTTSVVNPEFTVEKIALDPVVHVNNLTTFEIVIKNVGKTPLTGVFIEETNYEGLTYYSFIDTKEWTYSFDVNPKWQLIKSLQPNEVVTLRVIFNATNVGNWTNLVTSGSDGTENKTANNNTTVYVDEPPVIPEGKNSNITVEKIALEKVILVDSQVTFEIVVHNSGDRKLNNVTVYEKFSEGLVFDRIIDASNSWIKNNDLSFTLYRELLIGETVKFYLVFNATKVGSLTNVVTVTSNETENKTSNDSIKVVEPKFEVNKVTLNQTVIAGQQVTFEIVVHNTGEVAINNLTVSESSFDGLTYDSWLDNTGLWIKNNDLSWTLDSTLLAGEYLGFLVVFNTTEAGNFTNVIVAKSNEVPNKTSNDTVKVLKPELKVKKVTINQTVVVGQQVIFEIIAENIGEAVLNDVIVRELEFVGLTYTGWFDNSGKWIKNNDLSWTLNSTLSVKESANFFVVFNTTDLGNFTNVIVAKSNYTNDTYANNTTNVIGSDLSIEKLVSNSSPNLGDVIEWTIVVTNNGPADSKGVHVIDMLPSGLVYQSDDSEGNYNPVTGVWVVGDLANGATAKLVIKTLVNITNTGIVNMANVNSSTYDPNKDNNNANNTTNVKPAADLIISKVVFAVDGDKVTWGIAVKNLGPDAAINTRVVDVLSKALQFVSYNASKGVYDSMTGVWSIGDLANGEEVIILIETIVLGTGEIINEARVESDTYDPDMTNNYDYDYVVVEDIPDVEPVNPPEVINELPATGNPLIMVLLALIALGTAALRRRK